MWFKKKTINVQEKPFAFEPGKFYVMEYKMMAISVEEINFLGERFQEAGITCVLVANETNTRGLYPVEERKEKG
jgi:hypothetical protein